MSLTPEARARHAESQRLYRQRHPRKARLCERACFKKNRAKYEAAYKAKYPDRVKAQRTLSYLVWLGKIVKPWHCEDCGKKKAKPQWKLCAKLDLL
jgi:hypothetical protein